MNRIKDIHVPLLIIHGDRDEVIAYQFGQELFRAANEPKSFWTIEGATHNDLHIRGRIEFPQRLRAFYRSLRSKVRNVEASRPLLPRYQHTFLQGAYSRVIPRMQHVAPADCLKYGCRLLATLCSANSEGRGSGSISTAYLHSNSARLTGKFRWQPTIDLVYPGQRWRASGIQDLALTFSNSYHRLMESDSQPTPVLVVPSPVRNTEIISPGAAGSPAIQVYRRTNARRPQVPHGGTMPGTHFPRKP